MAEGRAEHFDPILLDVLWVGGCLSIPSVLPLEERTQGAFSVGASSAGVWKRIGLTVACN